MKINIDEAFILEVARVIKKVDGLRFAEGMGGENNATSMVVGPPHPPKGGGAAAVNGKRVLVKVTASVGTDPPGKYTGILQHGPVGGGSSGGGFNDGLTCEAWNLWESGFTTGHAHAIATGTGPYLGVVTGSNATTGNLVVHFFALPEGMVFTAALTSDGGSGGSQTSTPNFTYTAKTLDGTITLGTTLTPQRARCNGLFTAGTYGFCCYDKTGALKLIDAGETPNTAAC